MRTITECLGAVGFFMAVIWAMSIAHAPLEQKPVLACRPIATASAFTRHALQALPGGTKWAEPLQIMEQNNNRACLAYTVNWFLAAN